MTRRAAPGSAEWSGGALAEVEAIRATAAANGCPPPTGVAASLAARAVRALAAHAGLPRPHVAPSADGGVGITLRRAGRTAYVDVYNDGEVVLVLHDGAGFPDARDLDTSSDGGFSEAAARAERFLGEGR